MERRVLADRLQAQGTADAAGVTLRTRSLERSGAVSAVQALVGLAVLAGTYLTLNQLVLGFSPGMRWYGLYSQVGAASFFVAAGVTAAVRAAGRSWTQVVRIQTSAIMVEVRFLGRTWSREVLALADVVGTELRSSRLHNPSVVVHLRDGSRRALRTGDPLDDRALATWLDQRQSLAGPEHVPAGLGDLRDRQ